MTPLIKLTPLLAATIPAPHWMVQIVFALVLLSGCAFIVQGMWNGLMAEFPQMGRLSYLRAIHVSSILGLLALALIYLLL